MSLNSNSLLQTIKTASKTEANDSKLAIVTSSDDNGVYLKFYGEDTASQKPYKRVSTYTATAGDTVLVANINGSFVIVGKVV